MGAGDWGMLLFLSFLWGASFFFQKFALRDMGPFTMVFGRLALAALALNLVILLVGYRFSDLRGQWPAMILMSIFNNAVPFCLFGWSQTRIASGLAAIFNATAPLFTVLAAHLFTRDERLTPRKIVGVICGLAGVICIIGPGVLAGPRGSVAGQLACLLAAICYSLAAIYSRRFKGIPPIMLAGTQVAIAAIMVLPVALIFEHPWRFPLPGPKAAGALLALGLLSTAMAYAIYFRLLARVGATNTVLVTFLIPVTALILGTLVLHERLELREVGGMVGIVLGLSIIDGRIFKIFQKRPVLAPEEIHA
jgi:drug/metabolite transporter (DMT)-like permease